MEGSYPASLRNVAGSTRVPVRVWNNVRKGTWGLPPPVKLERLDMTYIVWMWCKTQNKQTTKIICYQSFHFYQRQDVPSKTVSVTKSQGGYVKLQAENKTEFNSISTDEILITNLLKMNTLLTTW
jgi:hypothetical protein